MSGLNHPNDETIEKMAQITDPEELERRFRAEALHSVICDNCARRVALARRGHKEGSQVNHEHLGKTVLSLMAQASLHGGKDRVRQEYPSESDLVSTCWECAGGFSEARNAYTMYASGGSKHSIDAKQAREMFA